MAFAVGSVCHEFITQKESSMKTNVASIDRTVRVVAGLILVGLSLAGIIGAWGWIGIVLVATGLIGFCPLYSLLGMNNCPAEMK